jgi:signal transduction histidine kinase
LKMRRTTGLQSAGILATLGLFAVITVLQSRWIAQLSDAELEGAKTRLQESLKAIRNDINQELMTAYVLFQFEPSAPSQSWGQLTHEAFARWQQIAKFPGLVHRLFVVQPDAASGALLISAYNAETKQYDPAEWPAELQDLRRQLVLPFTKLEVFGVRTFTGIALADGPVLVFPIIPSPSGPFVDAAGWLLIELDQRLLLSKVLPEIIRGDIKQAEQFDYQITRDAFPNKIIYRSDPNVTLSHVDASCSLLELGSEFRKPGISGRGKVGKFSRWFGSSVRLQGLPPAPPNEGGVWQLQVQHRAGSLEAAATKLRRSNLFLSLGMMALVAGDLALLALLARRAHRLGEAKMEFAAAVSHELRTPVAAICSTADNLAVGVALEPSRVQQYGVAILRQARQLSDLVEQILAFASGQFGKQHYEFEMLEPGSLVQQAIAATAPASREAGFEIEEHIASELPQVMGDSAALQQAVINLLTNAIKYGVNGRWIGVSVGCPKAGEIQIRVEDQGPGIPAAEVRRIFEPFYRGSSAAIRGTRGTGLGLTIVEQIARAHGGKVTVASRPGGGSCFALHLPSI